jgi:hypothetical protein
MSHVIEVGFKIDNLLALKWAAEACGPLALIVSPGLTIGADGKLYDAESGQLFTGKGHMHYRTWKDAHGRLVGDWPIPEGMTEAEVGDNAVAIIRVKDNGASYDVGVIAKGDGTYSLCHDFFNGGGGLETYVGKTTSTGHRSTGAVVEAYPTLSMYYQAMLVKYNASQLGVDLEFQKQEDGSIVAIADKANQLHLQQ